MNDVSHSLLRNNNKENVMASSFDVTLNISTPTVINNNNSPTIIDNWKTQNERFDNAIYLFDEFTETNKDADGIQKQIDKIDEIYEIVKSAVANLKNLAKVIEVRREELRSGCCSRRGLGNRIFNAFNIFTKYMGGVGGLASLYQDNTTLRYAATGFLSAAVVCEGIVIYRDNNSKTKREAEELRELGKIKKKDDLAKAEKFLRFLDELRRLQQIGIENLQIKAGSSSQRVRIETFKDRLIPSQIAERVKKCLIDFDNEALLKRTDAAYDTIVSIIAKSLPEKDLLRQELEKVSQKKTTTPVLSYNKIGIGGTEVISEEEFTNKDKDGLDHKGEPSKWESEGTMMGDEPLDHEVSQYRILELPRKFAYLSVIRSHQIVTP
jgi:hypothetical protein